MNFNDDVEDGLEEIMELLDINFDVFIFFLVILVNKIELFEFEDNDINNVLVICLFGSFIVFGEFFNLDVEFIIIMEIMNKVLDIVNV